MGKASDDDVMMASGSGCLWLLGACLLPRGVVEAALLSVVKGVDKGVC